jgi:CRP/FNR family cyclic AMP-dependent transcriptional regulator
MPRTDRYLQHLAAVPMFQACSRQRLEAIGRLAENYKVDAGTVLVREGRREDEFYLIVEGGAVVTKGGKKVATLGPGDYFGELAVLVPGPRNATVTTTMPSEVLGIASRDFWALATDVPPILLSVMVGTARRLHEADGRSIR